MSKRRRAGEFVLFRDTIHQVPDPSTWKEKWGRDDFDLNKGSCLLCNDPLCVEYANIQALDKNLKPLKHGPVELWSVHMSECQMEDYNISN